MNHPQPWKPIAEKCLEALCLIAVGLVGTLILAGFTGQLDGYFPLIK